MWQKRADQTGRPFLISTHTSRVGCDSVPTGATDGHSDFYSHIPCGMWQICWWKFVSVRHFYSHIPCGMWHGTAELKTYVLEFLLTHPVWDVTTTADVNDNVLPISTHTSRVGCDHMLSAPYFYNQISTHTSRVGCDSYTSDGVSVTDLFLLTHPVWDVTQT